MRLLAAFFADSVVINERGAFDIANAGFGSTSIPASTSEVTVQVVCVCESSGDEVGNDVTIRVTMLDANGEPMPGGIRFNAAIPGLVQLVPVEFGFPVHPGGGRHVFTIQVIGQDGELVLPLDVKVMS